MLHKGVEEGRGGEGKIFTFKLLAKGHVICSTTTIAREKRKITRYKL